MSLNKLIAPVGKEYLPYQLEGIEFALDKKSCLIADEMGLGKTIQALGVINNSPSANKVIVVCPNSLVFNWWKEIDEWLVKKTSIQVFSYEDIAKINPFGFDLLIADEAHYLKSGKAKRTQDFKKLAHKARQKILLTGTPILNKPLELWSLLQILDADAWDPPGKVKGRYVGKGEGANFFNFAKRYCNAHEKRFGTKKFWDFSGSSNLDELSIKLRESLMIRRLKSEVLKDLPEKTYQIVTLPKTEIGVSSDLEFYLGHIENGDFENSIAALKSDKVAFEEFSKKRHQQGIEKVEYCIEYILNVLEERDKVIVFAHHKEVIDKLSETLVFSGCVRVTSDMSAQERNDAVQVFKDDPNCKIILGSIDVMGVGFTLTESSIVIFAEISPVPGKMAQAVDRAHRIGQKENVLVQYLVQDESIDARMCKILIKKQRILSAALNVVRQPEDDIDKDTDKDIEPVVICKHTSITVKGSYYRCADCNVIMR